jgi:enoyl-CoA hydratase/carnithine racemase
VSDDLVRERRGNVLVTRLNRPEVRNALDATLIRSIGEAMNDADPTRRSGP